MRRGIILLAILLAACSGGGGGGTGSQSCTGDCNTTQPAQDFLTAAEVQRIIAQASAESPFAWFASIWAYLLPSAVSALSEISVLM